MPKTGCYIDGFNLYHAIKDLKKPSLKWLDLKGLASSFCRKDDTLVRVAYFTALWLHEPAKSSRHRRYIDAVKATGVDVVESNFRKGDQYCHGFKRWCDFREEKQTDVALAVTVLGDAVDGLIDRAILVTADSDHVPLIRALKERRPTMDLTLAPPPGRLTVARELAKQFADVREITAGRLAASTLPRDVFGPTGKKVASCPAEWLEAV